MPDDVLTRSPQTTPEPAPGSQEAADTRDLAGFGYKQELKRILGFYSSFAVAFSYISPSTGIFTLYALGLGTGGAFFFWTWPIVAIGQLIVALNFAEVSSHFPVAGSVYQWTKYLSNRTYSWFTGWVYLFAGVLTVTAVDVTILIVLIQLLNSVCGRLRYVGPGNRLRQPVRNLHDRHVHVAVRHLWVRHGEHAGRRDQKPEAGSAQSGDRRGHRRLHHRGDLPLLDDHRHPRRRAQ